MAALEMLAISMLLRSFAGEMMMEELEFHKVREFCILHRVKPKACEDI